MRACLLVLASSALVTTTSGARADDPGAAQVLFDEGKAAMAAGDYAKACAKLEDSHRLQPAGGTVMYLALCREAEGKTATAWLRFNETLSLARRDNRADRERVAQEHLASLAPKLTKLTIVVPQAVADTHALEIKRDGEIVPRLAWGTAVPVDPGPHAITARAPGKLVWTGQANASTPGDTVSIEIPELGTDASDAHPEADARQASTSTDVKPSSGRKTVAIVIGAVGLAGVVAGGVLGGLALSKKSQENDYCPGGAQGPCNAQGVALSNDAVTFGNASTIAIGVGAAAVVAGVVLWVTAPSAKAPGVAIAPLAGPRGGGLGLGGAF